MAVIAAINARYGSGVGIVVNWGRSVLEARSAEGALQHIALARQHGLLAGLMFSGASGQDTPYGAWRDSHMPPAPAAAGGIGAEGSSADRGGTAGLSARQRRAAAAHPGAENRHPAHGCVAGRAPGLPAAR